MTVPDIPQLIERARAHLDVEDFDAARSDYEAILARDKDMTEALKNVELKQSQWELLIKNALLQDVDLWLEPFERKSLKFRKKTLNFS